ncbi:hypothetical protein MCO_01103 [Bartonella sp. DB5-6]|uniref:hypothetical protein n=1 Tax=Bartonella sp. DB5-6 TaxID=1094755 RepID=UPI00026E8AEF|nr:hypothetical protein [Bartonella sp. DB5-6]EJF79435.1 hypothetical protein MCO_01001 [Bartonella sp. DB5-6]EJF79537.1 hypothetical protein MCO_01103 [Bartonella sp. DB5-6]
MREYPEHLNTKQDYLNMFEFDKAETVKRLEQLLETRFYWVAIKELGEGEEGIEDERHKIDMVTEMPIGLEGVFLEKRIQYELQESEYAPIFALGFSVEEVEQLIKENRE